MPKRERPSRPSGPIESMKQAFGVLAEIEEHMDELLTPLHDEVQGLLERLSGNFGSHEACYQVIRRVQNLVDRLNLSLACPLPDCGLPSRLSCGKCTSLGKRYYDIQFVHLREVKPRRHGGRSTMPRFRLVHLDGQNLSSPRPRLSDPSAPLERLDEALPAFIELEERMDRILEPMRAELQQYFDRLVGVRFNTLKAMRRSLLRMQRLVHRLRLGYVCPKTGCGRLGLLRCVPTTSPTHAWTFQIEHLSGGRQLRHSIESYGMGGRFPPLKLVPRGDENLGGLRSKLGKD